MNAQAAPRKGWLWIVFLVTIALYASVFVLPLLLHVIAFKIGTVTFESGDWKQRSFAIYTPCREDENKNIIFPLASNGSGQPMSIHLQRGSVTQGNPAATPLSVYLEKNDGQYEVCQGTGIMSKPSDRVGRFSFAYTRFKCELGEGRNVQATMFFARCGPLLNF